MSTFERGEPRRTQILRLFQEAEMANLPPPSLSQLAEHFAIVKSVAHNHLQTLVREHWLLNRKGHYQLPEVDREPLAIAAFQIWHQENGDVDCKGPQLHAWMASRGLR